MSLRTLNGKVVVISGAGGGMGREMARLAASQRALLALSDWDADALAETVDIVKALGAEVRSDVVDVSDRAAVGQWATDVVGQFGRVNLVVNNAGVSMSGDFEDMSYEEFDWIVGINFNGVVNGTKEFLPHLIASGNGAPGQHLLALRPDLDARPERLQRHQVRRPRLHRGAARGDARQRAPRDGHVRPPRRDQDRHRPQRPHHRPRGPGRPAATFDEKLARMPADKAAGIILKGALAGKARVLVGADAHAMHHFAKLAGSRYQDIVARIAPRVV